MMKHSINILIILIFFCTIFSGSCTKKLNVFDENNPTSESYFKTAAELQEGVNAAYSTLRSGQLVGREWFFVHDMRGSEMAAGGSQLEAPRAELLTQPSPSTTNSVLTDYWTGLYRMINRTNLVIEKGADVTDEPDLVSETIGEAKFLRAWAYFELVSQFGEVPVYTENSKEADGYQPKSSVSDIYSLIIDDLTDAVSRLDWVPLDKGRATRGAAYAMLGRVQMQKGDYDAAKTALLEIYNKYSLMGHFLYNFDGDVALGEKVFTEGHEFNDESIFEVVFYDRGTDNFNWNYDGEGTTSEATSVRSQEYGTVWGNIIPSNVILKEFEPGDPRFNYTFWEEGDKVLTKGGTEPGVTLTAADMNVATSTLNGVTEKRIYRKYSILDWTDDLDFHPDGLNHRLIRYADVLLMLAECEAEVGTPQDAAGYINEVRSRPDVNMPPVTASTKEDAIKAVMHERSVELAGEEVNNIDILRWRNRGYYPSIRPDPKPGQKDFLPIPNSETSANPKLQ